MYIGHQRIARGDTVICRVQEQALKWHTVRAAVVLLSQDAIIRLWTYRSRRWRWQWQWQGATTPTKPPCTRIRQQYRESRRRAGPTSGRVTWHGTSFTGSWPHGPAADQRRPLQDVSTVQDAAEHRGGHVTEQNGQLHWMMYSQSATPHLQSSHQFTLSQHHHQ